MEKGAPDVRLTDEQRKLGRKVARQRRVLDFFWQHQVAIRLTLVVIGLAWLAALPYHELWKGTFVDEHALQPAQATTYFGWEDVHAADQYLGDVERLAGVSNAGGNTTASWEERAAYLQTTFASVGLETGTIPGAPGQGAVWARVAPPRSPGTEAILVSANWESRDGVPNVRGVSLLLALGRFLRGQNHWAFDIYLVVGEGYIAGLESWIRDFTPRANIWTAINVDYPYHSFSHVGVFYEGVNGRLPNQDVINVVSRTCRYSGGVEPGLHTETWNPGTSYMSGAKHLWEHFKYTALGRPSAAHGVLAKHRIDAITLYANPAEGPHGYHTLGRVVEATLRSFNNLLERLHASFFFYLMPSPDHFLPVGHYLPAAVLLGASITLGGFDCPDPVAGILWALPAFAIGLVAWGIQMPYVVGFAILLYPPETARKSLRALAHLAYGALVPTLAMVNFPQAVLLALITLFHLAPFPRLAKICLMVVPVVLLAGLLIADIDLRAEWELYGNVAWPAVFALWIPLQAIAIMT